jgi:hypothetical protein
MAAAASPMSQVMEQFKQGIPDPGGLADLLHQLTPAEIATIAKNPGYLDQIQARAGGFLLEIYGALGMADSEPEEESAESESHEAPSKDAAKDKKADAPVAKDAPGAVAKKEDPKLKPDPAAIPGFIQKDVTNAVQQGWNEWRKLTDLSLQTYFLTHLTDDVAAAKATGKHELMDQQGPHLPKPPDLGTILGSFGEWAFKSFEGPRHQDIDYSVEVLGGTPVLTPVLLFFSGLIQYDFWSEALGAGVELTVSAPSNKTVKLAAGVPVGLEAINVDAVRPRVQGMSKKP